MPDTNFRRETVAAAAERNLPIKSEYTCTIGDVRAFRNLDGMLQFVGDRGNQPVSDRVLRSDFDPDVPVPLRPCDRNQAGTDPSTSAYAGLDEDDDVRPFKRVDQFAKSG